MEEPQKINHFLVPEHVKLTDDEKRNFLKKNNISLKHLPQILASDSGVKSLNVNIGDIIKIIRKSPTAGKTEFYRVVVHG